MFVMHDNMLNFHSVFLDSMLVYIIILIILIIHY
jgi:hypothetical protein